MTLQRHSLQPVESAVRVCRRSPCIPLSRRFPPAGSAVAEQPRRFSAGSSVPI